MEKQQQNIIETALSAAKQPVITSGANGTPVIFYPNGKDSWDYAFETQLLDKPLRKKGTTHLHDTASLIKYVQKHQQEGTQVFVDADYSKGNIEVTAIINGHTSQDADWADHRAFYSPRHTPAAKKWLDNTGEKMNQAQFAAFLTNCARDIVSKNPDNENAVYPTAAEVLDFALNLEYTEKTTFKQGYREQDGRINFTFQSEDAGKTETNLKAFERFAIAFTPFQGGDSYFVEALLKFRIDKNSGALVLWYELQQIEAVIEQATADIAKTLQDAFADIDIYFGRP
ncbi:DUF2303 family protein [Neisseria musculi]|uniref:DUF2303 family protein n=1 Tax=Neisseria musculi TaxID=1815583 RepID=A0A7H1MCZ2_9NEIS|nr:DUF2303 family protein [Neisseria musculi]QNT59507.1 hypothetical protein H7A79_1643 [Neisseria musculi]